MEDKKFEDLMNELEMNVKKLENGECLLWIMNLALTL